MFLISAANALAAAIYVYMQYVDTTQVLIVIGQFSWLAVHGKHSLKFW